MVWQENTATIVMVTNLVEVGRVSEALGPLEFNFPLITDELRSVSSIDFVKDRMKETSPDRTLVNI